MKKTAALRAAQSAVGRPFGYGTSWSLYHPWDDGDITGPSTEMADTSYTALMQRRARRVAGLALALMGVADDGYAIAMSAPMSARAYVDMALS